MYGWERIVVAIAISCAIISCVSANKDGLETEETAAPANSNLATLIRNGAKGVKSVHAATKPYLQSTYDTASNLASYVPFVRSKAPVEGAVETDQASPKKGGGLINSARGAFGHFTGLFSGLGSRSMKGAQAATSTVSGVANQAQDELWGGATALKEVGEEAANYGKEATNKVIGVARGVAGGVQQDDLEEKSDSKDKDAVKEETEDAAENAADKAGEEKAEEIVEEEADDTAGKKAGKAAQKKA